MKKMMVGGVLFLMVLMIVHTSQAEATINPMDAFDCYDGCSTGCVQRDTRLMQRCDRKCQIRCGPDSKIEGHLN